MPIENADSVSDIAFKIDIIGIEIGIEKSTVLFVVGLFLFFFIYSVYQKLYERGSEIQSVKFIITSLPIVVSLIILTIDAEKYYSTIIITVITGGISGYIHNLFEIKENDDKKFQEVNENLKSLKTTLEKTNDDYINILCNPAFTFKANEKFSEKLQIESFNVANYYTKERETLEVRIGGNFPDSVTVDQEVAKLLFSISSKKSISALEQFSRGEMFLRIKLFKEFWEEAVQSSSSYLSICDLSIYSGKDESEIGSEKVNWERRIEAEIKALTEGGTKKFDKIILCEGASGSHDENFILQAVKAAWIKEIEKLKSAGIKSHYAAEDRHNNMIWMASHNEFSDKIFAINGSRVPGQINSNDLGTFGDYLIGEEFKVSKEPKLSKEATPEGWEETEFLYRINANPAIVEEVRRTITRMITDGEIKNIA